MELVRALRAEQSIRAAFVGGGGKTTAMFALARQLPPPVLVTTSTHLGTVQLRQADRHFEINSYRDITTKLQENLSGVIALTGSETEPERCCGLDVKSLETLKLFADELNIPLLIEADGSRTLPLKAPASHEPAIPPWVECVVVVIGMTGLGKPLLGENVHRAEIFSRLSGLPYGSRIDISSISKVLLNAGGGQKGIPPGSKKILLLNQADDPLAQGSARQLACNVQNGFDSILISALRPGLEDDTSEVSIPDKGGVFACLEPVAGIILAGGESHRFGHPKVLLPWNQEPILRHIVKTSMNAGLQSIQVVTGPVDEPIRQVLCDLPVTVTHNQYWRDGQSASIRAGLNALGDNIGSVIFLLGDMPLIQQTLIRSLVSVHEQTLAPIVAPLVEGKRANPVLFDRSTFSALKNIRGDVGGKAIFSQYSPVWLPWNDPAALFDIDTPEDYQKLIDGTMI